MDTMKSDAAACGSYPAPGCSAPYWMVLNPAGYAPRVRHLTEESARIEAERLARANVGHRFIVLKAVAQCRVRPQPEVIWSDGWQDVPF